MFKKFFISVVIYILSAWTEDIVAWADHNLILKLI